MDNKIEKYRSKHKKCKWCKYYKWNSKEVGIDLSENDLELMISYKHKYTITDVYLTKKEIPIEAVTIQKEEVQEAKYVSFEEFEQMILDGVVADNITEYYPYFKTICSYT